MALDRPEHETLLSSSANARRLMESLQQADNRKQFRYARYASELQKAEKKRAERLSQRHRYWNAKTPKWEIYLSAGREPLFQRYSKFHYRRHRWVQLRLPGWVLAVNLRERRPELDQQSQTTPGRADRPS